MECLVNFKWDDEASVWIATSEDVPGLVLESDSYDALVDKVGKAIPELVKLNSMNNIVSINLRSERRLVVTANG